jgi:hypothetical protein
MQNMQVWLVVFVGIIALGAAVQTIINVAMFLLVSRLAAKVDTTVSDLRLQIAPTLTRVQNLVDEISPRVTGIVTDASEMTRLARSQAQKLDRVFTEAVERLRLQLIHVDQILTGTMETLEDAGSQLKKSVLGPVARATAIIRGIQTGVEYFRSNRQNNSKGPRSEATHQDEGMFI